MENEGILLRQTQHLKRMISQLNDQNFAETFGDIKLVFVDGELYYYKVLLSKLLPSWGQMLRSSDEVDLVIVEKVKRKDFLSHVMTDKGKDMECLVDELDEDIKIEVEEFNVNYPNNDHSYGEDSVVETDDMSSTLEIPKDKEKKDHLKTYSVVTETIAEKDLKEYVDDNDVLLKSERKVVSCITPNFCWPNHLAAPNYHSIRWGQTRSTVVLEVMGNRSIFTVLSEKHKNLPPSTAFTIRCSDDDEEQSGVFNLRDFVNSGADKNIAAFKIDGREKKVNLVEVLKSMGYDKNCKEEYMVENASKNINILVNEEYENLKNLTNIWKDNVIGDTADQELIGYSRMDRDVMNWLQTEAKKTPDGGEVCCYCGFVCFEQSLSGNFKVHMKKHLYRKKHCKRCNENYLPQDNHICSSLKTVKTERVTCTECGQTFSSRTNMVIHLKRVHNIIDKVVTLRECGFCFKKVPNLSKHYSEFHKNEELACQYCDKTFSNPSKFKSHVDMAHKKIYSGFCNICQKECPNLMKHNLQCHNEKTYQCDHCEKVFKNAKTLEDHMKSVNGTREKKPCPECGNLYVNVNDHINRFHKGHKKKRNVKYCPSCQKNIQREKFDDHKLTCIEEETICHICSKKVVKIGRHLAMIHQVFDRRCYLCNVDFQTYLDLNSHLRVEHFPKIMKEEEFLEMDLQTEDKIQKECIATKFVELYSSNSQEDKIECNFCRYKTITVIFMITHMKEHLGFTFRKGKAPNTEIEKVCPDCGRIVKSQVTDHIKSCKKKIEQLVIHDGPLQGTVETRGLLGLTVDQYEVQGIREILAKFPEKKKAATKSKLVKETEFPCDKCGKKFKKQVNLRKHLEKVHSVKTVKCQETDSMKLVIHDGTLQDTLETGGLLGLTDMYEKYMDQEMEVEMDMVTGEEIQGTRELMVNDSEKTKMVSKTKLVKQTEFHCDQCEKIFKKQANLRKHVDKIHGEKQYSCELKLR